MYTQNVYPYKVHSRVITTDNTQAYNTGKFVNCKMKLKLTLSLKETIYISSKKQTRETDEKSLFSILYNQTVTLRGITTNAKTLTLK